MIRIPKGFKLNGTVTDNGLTTVGARRIMEHLDHLPADELVTSAVLANTMKWRLSAFRNYMGEVCLIPYRLKMDNRLVWGSKSTIKKLRRSLES